MTSPIVEDPQRMVYNSPNTIDRILSKEILDLSLRDRNAIYEEIHGVSSLAPKETPELLETALQELSEKLVEIPDTQKPAFLESQLLSSSPYANDPGFRLRFLRCELFDAHKAAVRLVKFLGFVSELFGNEALLRPPRFTDLTREEQKQFRTGNLQRLPFRDRCGRPVSVWVDDFGLQQGSVISRMKIGFYLLWTLSEDIESQQKGLTFLVWAVQNQFDGGFPGWENAAYHSKLDESIPLRKCVSHFCVPDRPYFHVLRSMFAMTLGGTRSRLRFHVGEEIELRYILKTHGIPVELIPLTGTGKIKTGFFKEWVRTRKVLEDMRAKGKDDEASTIIELPGMNDVVFKPNVSLTCHPRNLWFQGIIESRIQEHLSASQSRKKAITKEIIDVIQQSGGRFLVWDKRGWWTQLKDLGKIHERVATAVREFKFKAIAKRQNQQQVLSGDAFVFAKQMGKRRKMSKDHCCQCFFDEKGHQQSIAW